MILSKDKKIKFKGNTKNRVEVAKVIKQDVIKEFFKKK